MEAAITSTIGRDDYRMFKLMATILTKRKQKSLFPSRENVIFRSLKSEATSVILKEKSCSNQILYHYWL